MTPCTGPRPRCGNSPENTVPPLCSDEGVARVVRPFLVNIVIRSYVKSLIAPFDVPPPVAVAFEKCTVPKSVSLFVGASMIHSAELKSKLEDERLGAGSASSRVSSSGSAE